VRVACAENARFLGLDFSSLTTTVSCQGEDGPVKKKLHMERVKPFKNVTVGGVSTTDSWVYTDQQLEY
jgi:hypothetical protein